MTKHSKILLNEIPKHLWRHELKIIVWFSIVAILFVTMGCKTTSSESEFPLPPSEETAYSNWDSAIIVEWNLNPIYYELAGLTAFALPEIPEGEKVLLDIKFEGEGKIWKWESGFWTELKTTGFILYSQPLILAVAPAIKIGETVGFIIDWLFPPIPCNKPILLTGKDKICSNWKETEEAARTEARKLVQGAANNLARDAADGYKCPNDCPNPKSDGLATADIYDVTARHLPVKGIWSQKRWVGCAYFTWSATVVCVDEE